ncbi:MAG: hypothetical protein ACRDN0_07650 [Trebonia sp.]
MTTVETALPLLGLRIKAGPVELRGMTDDLLGPLADLAVAGIHAPDAMPFSEPWSIAPAGDLPKNVAQYHWGMCAFLFDHLDAGHITSAAFTDNPASLAVSRKVGYMKNGWRRIERLGQPAVMQDLLLRPEKFARFEHELAVEGLPEFRRSIGLDA